MKLSALTIKMMINTTGDWLDEEGGIRDPLDNAGALGAGVLEELEAAHIFVADLDHKRTLIEEQLRTIVDLITKLDYVHDSKARGLYYALDALVEVSDDDEEAAPYLELKQRLFPMGLRVVRLPFIEEGGAAEQLERSIGPEFRQRLVALSIGERSLDKVFSQWIRAGQELGRAVNRRAKLQASLMRQGSAAERIDTRAGRIRWIEAVEGLLWAIRVRVKLSHLAEPVEAALRGAIGTSRRRATAGGKEGKGGAEEQAPSEDDEDDVGEEVDGPDGGQGQGEDEDEDEDEGTTNADEPEPDEPERDDDDELD